MGVSVFDFSFAGHQSGHGLHDQVVTRPVGVRPLASEGCVVAVDDLRVDRRQRFVVDAEFCRHVGSGIDDHNVDIRDHLAYDIRCFGSCQVQWQAALASVERHKRLAFAGDELECQPPGFALQGFDFYYVGAHVGEEHATKGACDDLGELQDFDTVERSGHFSNFLPGGTSLSDASA